MPDCLHIKGVDQASPIESTYTDGCIYPDPTGFGTQTLPNDADTLPKRPHHYGPYFQASHSKAKEIESVDPFAEDEYWSKQSWDADQEQYLADLDPFPEETQHSGIQGDSRSQGQLSTATMEQTREDIPHNSSSSREANLPMGTANTVTSGSICSAGYPFGYAQQNISYSKPTCYPGSFLEKPQHSIYSVGYPFRYASQSISYPTYCPSSPLEERTHNLFDSPYSPGHGLEQPSGPSETFSDYDSPSASVHQTASSLKKRKRTSRAQQPSPSKRSKTAYTPQGGLDTTSISGRKKVNLGQSMGSDNRPRAGIRVENGVLFGLVNNEWSKLERLESARALRLILEQSQLDITWITE